MKKLITMLSALTITSSTASFAVACSSKEETGLDLSKITADTILNFETEYKVKDDKGVESVVKPDKLGSLTNDQIIDILSNNLMFIVATKLTEIDKSKFNISKMDISKLSETEAKNFVNFVVLVNSAISHDVKEKQKDSKIFIATIEIMNWDKVNENDQLKNGIIQEQKEAKEFLDKSDEDKKKAVSHSGMTTEQIEKAVNDKIERSNQTQKQSFDQIKIMYDGIKGKEKKVEITIDLTSKQ